MHAKPGLPVHIALAALSETHATPVAAPDNALSAAVSKVLGSRAARPHLAGVPGADSARSPVNSRIPGAGGFDRPVIARTIGPRKGHR